MTWRWFILKVCVVWLCVFGIWFQIPYKYSETLKTERANPSKIEQADAVAGLTFFLSLGLLIHVTMIASAYKMTKDDERRED